MASGLLVGADARYVVVGGASALLAAGALLDRVEILLERSLALGANRLKALPDLAQVPLLHLGLGCNQVDDHSLPVLLSGLPSKLASFDLGTNGLVSLDPALHQLQVLRALRHLTLAGNPVARRADYRRVCAARIATLTLLDDSPVAAADQQRGEELLTIEDDARRSS